MRQYSFGFLCFLRQHRWEEKVYSLVTFLKRNKRKRLQLQIVNSQVKTVDFDQCFSKHAIEIEMKTKELFCMIEIAEQIRTRDFVVFPFRHYFWPILNSRRVVSCKMWLNIEIL